MGYWLNPEGSEPEIEDAEAEMLGPKEDWTAWMELGNLFTAEETGMVYTPESFCDVTTGADCYLLSGGAVLSGTWF